jgi:hypothetical protein
VIQEFTSNRWRGREVAVYQQQNDAGQWEVRAQSLQPNRIERDVLVFTSNRRVTAEDFGREGQILPRLEQAAARLNAPENIRQTPGAGPNHGNPWDAAVGIGTGALFDIPKGVGGIPEGLWDNSRALLENFADAGNRIANTVVPGDLSRDPNNPSHPFQFEQRNRRAETNSTQNAVQGAQNRLAEALGANPQTTAFQAGDVIGGLLAPTPGRAGRAGATDASAITMRRQLDSVIDTASFGQIKSGLDRLGPEGMERLAREYPNEAGQIARRLDNFNDPEAARLARVLRGEEAARPGPTRRSWARALASRSRRASTTASTRCGWATTPTRSSPPTAP